MSLAEEFTPIEDDEPDAQTRPEELRLLEALLFAAGEPLDEKALADRMPSGNGPAHRAAAAADRVRAARRQPGAHRP